jgi:hypothetical protein
MIRIRIISDLESRKSSDSLRIRINGHNTISVWQKNTNTFKLFYTNGTPDPSHQIDDQQTETLEE